MGPNTAAPEQEQIDHLAHSPLNFVKICASKLVNDPRVLKEIFAYLTLPLSCFGQFRYFIRLFFVFLPSFIV